MRKTLNQIPIRFLLWGLMPLILFAIILPFYSNHFLNYAREIIDATLTWFIIYALGFLLSFKVVKRFWFFVTLTLFSFSIFFKLSFYYLYESKLTLSAFYILFETNASEAGEFLSTYFNWFVIVLFLILFFALYKQYQSLFSKTPTKYSIDVYSSFKIKNVLIASFLLGGVFISGYVIKKKLSAYNIYYSTKNAYMGYEEMQRVFQSNLAKPTSNHFSGIISKDIPQTYVVVIGESTTSKNMSLYGYYRKTNPKLEEIRDELLVFNNVIAPNAHTIPSLNKVLTLSNYENIKAIEMGSALQLANGAGFETYWISNQQPLGIYENMVTLLSKACDNQIFLSEENSRYGSPDEVVFPHLKSALQDTAKKKLIIVHLMGTHSVYKYRYPESFNIFKNAPQTKFPSETATTMINEYDNAVLYNDFVVREIIDLVKAENKNSFVVYFSDHGDEVFHDINFIGHSEYQGTDAMYEVPFLVWLSEDFKKFNANAKNIAHYTDRKYLLDDFIHSLFDLGRIQFDQLEPERSIFSPDFKNRKRIIKNHIDFDAR